jgi:aryl-alcohol dehydrogenase-like predicted oxidoreductase
VRWGRLVAHDRIFMQFTKFSRTGLTVSRLCLGTGTFGKQTDEAESFRVFDKASDAGLWLKGKRNRFLLGTKAGRPMGSSPWDRGSSRKHLLDAIDASLRRLNTDKARSIGVSNFLAYRLARAIGRQDTLRLVHFVSAQPATTCCSGRMTHATTNSFGFDGTNACLIFSAAARGR